MVYGFQVTTATIERVNTPLHTHTHSIHTHSTGFEDKVQLLNTNNWITLQDIYI